MRRIMTVVCLCLALFQTRMLFAAVIVVNSSQDNVIAGDGLCTLREAILNANTNSDTTGGDCIGGSMGGDTIIFTLPAAGGLTITPTSALPVISDPVVIDGSSQSGYRLLPTRSLGCADPFQAAPPASQSITLSQPLIEINGTLAGNVNGFILDTDNTVIRGLIINRFQRNGIVVVRDASDNLIEENYIGTDRSGTMAQGNNWGVQISDRRLAPLENPNRNILRNNLISGNRQAGIVVAGDANTDTEGNLIVNNLIGTDVTGTQALGNTGTTSGYGVVLGDGNLVAGIGSRRPAQYHTVRGNVIAASYTYNVWVSNFASNNLITCNHIGTDVSGTLQLGNCIDGLLIGGTQTNGLSQFNVVQYNLISGNSACQGNSEANVTLQWGAEQNTVEYNLIGTDMTGTLALSPILSSDGIGIKKPNNVIRYNVIGGHRRHGIHIYRGFGRLPLNNVLQNNLIGISTTESAIPNGGDGIAIFSNIFTPNNVLQRQDVSLTGTLIQNNTIAFNRQNGIRLEARGDETGFTAEVHSTLILNNAIHHNASNGVVIFRSETAPQSTARAEGNVIQNNQIYENGGLGISLSASLPSPHDILSNGSLGFPLSVPPPTLNDINDADAGANLLQNYPFLSSAFRTGSQIHVEGGLNGLPNTAYTVEFFASAAPDSSGYGEGQQSLQQLPVTTNSAGDALYAVDLPSAASTLWITATATDPSGNTSEFSSAELVGTSVDVSIAITEAADPVTANTPFQYVVAVGNQGDEDASNVTAHFQVTGNFQIQVLPAECALTVNAGDCVLGTMTGQSQRILIFTIQPLQAGVVSIQAQVETSSQELYTLNNQDQEDTRILDPSQPATTAPTGQISFVCAFDGTDQDPQCQQIARLPSAGEGSPVKRTLLWLMVGLCSLVGIWAVRHPPIAHLFKRFFNPRM
jgi:CSLREA domain-containing protein